MYLAKFRISSTIHLHRFSYSFYEFGQHHHQYLFASFVNLKFLRKRLHTCTVLETNIAILDLRYQTIMRTLLLTDMKTFYSFVILMNDTR